MTHVWDHSEADGTELICLLALADWCNDEGFCYPGIKRLAAKCRVSERGVQKVLERLIEKGEIQIEYNQGKAVNGGNTNRYYLTKYREAIGETGGVVNAGSPGGVNGRSGGVVNAGSPKPLVYPSDKPSSSSTSINKVTADDDDRQKRGEVHKLWQMNMPGTLSPIIAEDLNDLITTYGPDEVKTAITLSVKANGRTIKYVARVLENRATGKTPHPQSPAAPSPQVLDWDSIFGETNYASH